VCGGSARAWNISTSLSLFVVAIWNPTGRTIEDESIKNKKKEKKKKGRKKFLVHLLSFSLFALSLHSLFRGLRAIPVHFVFGELKEE